MDFIRLPSLRYKADRRTIVFICLYFGLMAAGFAFWDSMEVWQMLLLLGATCVFSFINAAITHNMIHAPILREKRHNRWFHRFMSVAYGHPVSAYVHGHNLSHHLHTQRQKDAMRTSKAQFRWNLLNILFFFFLVVNDIRRAEAKYAKAMKTERPAWYRQFKAENLFVIATMAILALINWKALVVFFVLPHLYGTWGIIGVNFLQHDGADPESEHDHSRNFTGRQLNWWTFNNGLHTIHHMNPSRHWSLLRTAHEKEVAPYIHPELQQPSLIAYLWRSFIWPGKRIDFGGRPVSPPPAGIDEDWIPKRGETPMGVSLGAEN